MSDLGKYIEERYLKLILEDTISSKKLETLILQIRKILHEVDELMRFSTRKSLRRVLHNAEVKYAFVNKFNPTLVAARKVRFDSKLLNLVSRELFKFSTEMTPEQINQLLDFGGEYSKDITFVDIEPADLYSTCPEILQFYEDTKQKVTNKSLVKLAVGHHPTPMNVVDVRNESTDGYWLVSALDIHCDVRTVSVHQRDIPPPISSFLTSVLFALPVSGMSVLSRLSLTQQRNPRHA